MSYSDRWISCDDEGVEIRGYSFPFGAAKRIPYGSIRGVERRPIGWLDWRLRLWGSSRLGRWANFDLDRPRKTVALVLDLGERVRPVLTPDDPDAVEAEIRTHTGLRGLRPAGLSRGCGAGTAG